MSSFPIIDILLVEDNDDDVLMIQESFKGANMVNVMAVVHDGVEAMKYLRRESPYEQAKMPGLMLLDINMPRKGGFEVLAEVKADPNLRHIPIVMLTTSVREEDIVRSYGEGACSYVTKPVDFEDFKRVAEQMSLYWAMVARVPGVRQNLV